MFRWAWENGTWVMHWVTREQLAVEQAEDEARKAERAKGARNE